MKKTSLIVSAVLMRSITYAAAPVELVPVQKQDLHITTTQPASVEAFHTARIGTRVTGYVKSVHIDIGSIVKAGEPMVEIEAPEWSAAVVVLEAEVQQQRASIAAAEVRLAYAEFSSAQRQLDLSKRAVKSARKSYELNSERIYENNGLPLETLQSIKALAEAESLYLAIATKYNLAQLRLLSAAGQNLNVSTP